MALNFSHRPIFPAQLTEDNLVSPMRIDDRFDYGRDRAEKESVSTDVIDLLPSDPFGMSSTLTATITGWLFEDFEVDYGGYGRDEVGTSDTTYQLFADLNFYWNNAHTQCSWLEDLKVDYGRYGSDEVGTSDQNYQLFADLNFIWNNAMMFQGFPTNMGYEHYSNVASGSVKCFWDNEVEEESSSHDGLASACNVDDMFIFGNENVAHVDQKTEGLLENDGIFCDGEEGVPHAALIFSLGYLGVRDLLVVEKVSRSLCSTVRGDPLLWRSIHIGQPLNEKITDDVLLQLTNRAQGNLQCLSLVECPRITDDGLKSVLENNPRLTKLSVPGCTRLSIDGIVNSLKAFKSMGTRGVKHLRIGGLYGVTQKHFEELKLLLGTDSSMQQTTHKPHFYHRGKLYLSCEDERAIDVEMCPKCQNLRLVYDCPAVGCLAKEHSYPLCRACTLCIARCAHCGRCINDSEYEETFSLDLLCSDCGKCQERLGRKDPTISAVLDEPISVLSPQG